MTSDDDAQLFINPTTIAWGNELSNVQCIYQIWDARIIQKDFSIQNVVVLKFGELLNQESSDKFSSVAMSILRSSRRCKNVSEVKPCDTMT